MRSMMTQELSERVETVYADVYAYPLAIAVLLLLLETAIGDSPKRRPLSPSRPKNNHDVGDDDRAPPLASGPS